jgi:hypothetical protein
MFLSLDLLASLAPNAGALLALLWREIESDCGEITADWEEDVDMERQERWGSKETAMRKQQS